MATIHRTALRVLKPLQSIGFIAFKVAVQPIDFNGLFSPLKSIS